MAQGNRSKELWLVPKRSNLHQTICLIDGILERNYDGKTWDPQKQNNLGVNLKNWGATRDGKNISNQSIRTLLALPQYLGFLYIDTSGTKNILRLTEAGKKLHEENIDNLVVIENLIKDKSLVINESNVVLYQLEKLQITNPTILKHCENIFVFPFRVTLELLRRLEYLDREEIAFFLLRIRDETEMNLTIKEIERFRKISVLERKEIIEEFKKTHIGNITLVQAPSASYFERICTMTGIVEQVRQKRNNMGSELSTIRIKTDYKDYVEEILNEKYKSIDIFDFEDNLQLWIEYIGNPSRIYTPINVEIKNMMDDDVLLKIIKENKYIDIDLLEKSKLKKVAMFPDEEYIIEVVDVKDGRSLGTKRIIPNNNNDMFNLDMRLSHKKEEESILNIKNKIIEHSKSNSFEGEMKNYLIILEKNIGVDKLNDKSLRGAYYEYLFYRLLDLLRCEGKIDDVIWNGKIGKYGLPVAAPGGKLGKADIIFSIDNTYYVLELTTIKSKSMQERVEVASVSDHIKIFKEKISKDYNVVGIFCAPIIHHRNTVVMKTIINKNGIEFLAMEDLDLLNILVNKSRAEIKNELRQ